MEVVKLVCQVVMVQGLISLVRIFIVVLVLVWLLLCCINFSQFVQVRCFNVVGCVGSQCIGQNGRCWLFILLCCNLISFVWLVVLSICEYVMFKLFLGFFRYCRKWVLLNSRILVMLVFWLKWVVLFISLFSFMLFRFSGLFVMVGVVLFMYVIVLIGIGCFCSEFFQILC